MASPAASAVPLGEIPSKVKITLQSSDTCMDRNRYCVILHGTDRNAYEWNPPVVAGPERKTE
jgi:hypothetical protein